MPAAQRLQVPEGAGIVTVDYPGYVRSTEAALDSLGGMQAVSNAYNRTNQSSIHLRCRPGDPLAHPIEGNRHMRNAVLLKVSKRQGSGTESGGTVQAEIVGHIISTYRFDAMADFQYTAPASTAEGNYPEVEGPYGLEREPLAVPPPVFSSVDTPVEYAFKATPPSGGGSKPGPKGALRKMPAKIPTAAVQLRQTEEQQQQQQAAGSASKQPHLI